CGRTSEFALPGGRILHITARSVEDDMLALELILFQGARPIMTTDFRLMNNGLLIVGGPHYKEGTLIISIGASAPSITAAQAHMRHRPVPPPVPMSAVGAAPDDNY